MTQAGLPDKAALTALQERYAIAFERERTPELLQRYGLQLR